jgi:hypothetical protein
MALLAVGNGVAGALGRFLLDPAGAPADRAGCWALPRKIHRSTVARAVHFCDRRRGCAAQRETVPR